MNCKSCGAPLMDNEEYCSYCGTITPYGEECYEHRKFQEIMENVEAERLKREQEKLKTELAKAEQRKQHLASDQQRESIKFPYVPILLVPVMYVCTFMVYGLYWYISRANSLNALNTGKKLNKWLCVFYALLCIGVFFFPSEATKYGYPAGSTANNYWGLVFLFAVGLSVWMAFRAHNILRRYSRERGFNVFAILLVFIGPIYLQWEVNKLLRLGILKSK